MWDGREGYVDRDGSVVIPARFPVAYPFEGALAPVELDEGNGLIDRRGEIVVLS